MNKACLGAVVLLAALSVAGCRQTNYKMQEKQNPNQDTRGVRDESYMEDRVNNNLPQGGSSPKDEYNAQQNIRPGDANGGNPPTREGGNIVERDAMRPPK